MFDMVLLKFLTQGAPIDTEVGCCPGLVVIAMSKNGLQHGLLNFGNHRIEQVAGQFAIEIIEIFTNRHFYRLLQ